MLNPGTLTPSSITCLVGGISVETLIEVSRTPVFLVMPPPSFLIPSLSINPDPYLTSRTHREVIMPAPPSPLTLTHTRDLSPAASVITHNQTSPPLTGGHTCLLSMTTPPPLSRKGAPKRKRMVVQRQPQPKRKPPPKSPQKNLVVRVQNLHWTPPISLPWAACYMRPLWAVC